MANKNEGGGGVGILVIHRSIWLTELCTDVNTSKYNYFCIISQNIRSMNLTTAMDVFRNKIQC